ncbi:MAG: hypothetical protein QM645_12085 [Asticcacaulis sp.]
MFAALEKLTIGPNKVPVLKVMIPSWIVLLAVLSWIAHSLWREEQMIAQTGSADGVMGWPLVLHFALVAGVGVWVLLRYRKLGLFSSETKTATSNIIE